MNSLLLRLFAAAVVLLAAPAFAHMQQAGDLQVIHPWAAPGNGQSQVHPTLANEGGAPIEIVGVRTPAAGVARLRLDGAAVAQVTLAAGDTLTPDALVIELDALAAPLVEGGHFPMTLELADGRQVVFHVVVGETSTMLEMQ